MNGHNDLLWITKISFQRTEKESREYNMNDRFDSSLLFSSSWDFKLDDLINRCFTKQQTKRLLIAVESKNANIKSHNVLYIQ